MPPPYINCWEQPLLSPPPRYPASWFSGMAKNKEAKRLPPGFRFHPTDEELVTYYLANKALDGKFTGRAVADVDLNKCEPWDLPGKAKMGEDEWYFFSLRDRKYPIGIRTNRTTNAGYWKTTGKDKEVVCSSTSEVVGFKKTLVFYMGRAPRGQKTNWVIHEYRLLAGQDPAKLFKDEWVVCRVFQKGCIGGKCYESSSPRFHPYSLGSIQLPPPAAVTTQGIDDLCNLENGVERSGALNLAELTRILAGNYAPIDLVANEHQQLHSSSSAAPVAASGCNQGFPFPGGSSSVSFMELMGAPSVCQNQLAMPQVNPLSTIGYTLGASKQHTKSFNEYQDMHGYWASF